MASVHLGIRMTEARIDFWDDIEEPSRAVITYKPLAFDMPP
jgi:hypothetical protein